MLQISDETTLKPKKNWGAGEIKSIGSNDIDNDDDDDRVSI